MNPEDFDARITRLESELASLRADKAIRELLAKHDYCLDSRRDDEWLALWTRDGLYDLVSRVVYPDASAKTFTETWQGSERLAEFITNPEGHHRPGFYGHSMHTASHNLVINVSGNEATARSYSVLYQESQGGIQLLSAGSNLWKLRRSASEWLLSERHKRQVGDAAFAEPLFFPPPRS